MIYVLNKWINFEAKPHAAVIRLQNVIPIMIMFLRLVRSANLPRGIPINA